jgi:hypothetical protein
VRSLLTGAATVVALALVFVVTHGGLSALGTGGQGSYSFLEVQPGTGSVPVTYSSCRPVTVEFNLHGVEDLTTTRQVLLQALGEASAASHLNVVFVRDSLRRPRPGGATETGYPVLIAFTDSDEMHDMVGVAGRGGSSWIERNGLRTYVSGQIVLERRYWNKTLPGWHGKEQTRAIVMHELGHVLGLGHVDDRHEIMSQDGSGQYEYGPGDRTGLARLGRGPCT